MRPVNRSAQGMTSIRPAKGQCGEAGPPAEASRQSPLEPKARSVLRVELARQRNQVRGMHDTDLEVDRTLAILRDVFGDPAFVALLRTRGFINIPRLLYERLAAQP